MESRVTPISIPGILWGYSDTDPSLQKHVGSGLIRGTKTRRSKDRIVGTNHLARLQSRIGDGGRFWWGEWGSDQTKDARKWVCICRFESNEFVFAHAGHLQLLQVTIDRLGRALN